MSNIFMSCLNFDEIGCVTPSRSTAPLVLTQVCRYWCQICLATPRLWSGIELKDKELGKLLSSDSESFLSRLDVWIARSGSCPISVKFSYTDLQDGNGPMPFPPEHGENSDYLKGMHLIIGRLLHCQNRWKALDMNVPHLSMVEPLLHAISVHPGAPLLQHLRIRIDGLFDEVHTYDLALSPQLQSVYILCQPILPQSHARFEHLTELELEYCSSIKGCLQWIDLTPNLETFKVHFLRMQSLESESHMRRLENLRTLEISSFLDNAVLGQFLKLLEIPVLTKLHVRFDSDQIETQNQNHIRDFLQRSPVLEALTLLWSPMSEEDVLECLQLSPGLTYLNLAPMTDKILHALTLSDDNGSSLVESRARIPLCPALKVIKISDIDDCSPTTLVNMVSSRCDDKAANPSRSLETVMIPDDPRLSLTKQPDIAQLTNNIIQHIGEVGWQHHDYDKWTWNQLATWK
ncbi:hypothetical protein DFH11DRAFT_1544508 [Phellopilus nigrolimitatus]|nr:hypothetical protein DFH11DRAFT_1544508 [Phellopilus nigrolimitatus]